MTNREHDAELESRVLIFAPIGRDAELTRDILKRGSIGCEVCHSITHLTETLAAAGAGALLLTEESLDAPDFSELVNSLEEQPPWSDVPVLLFAGAPGSDMTV